MESYLNIILTVFSGTSFLAVLILYLLSRQDRQKLQEELDEGHKQLSIIKGKIESLQKYQVILDAEAEAEKIKAEAFLFRFKTKKESEAQAEKIKAESVSEAERLKVEAASLRNNAQVHYDQKMAEATKLATTQLKESRDQAKEIRDRAERQLQTAHEIAAKMESDATEKAKLIAGEAWEAKQNADQYKATVIAMKNIIKGYGDEYLVPNRSVLDELAEEYEHKEAGQELAKIRTLIKSMIKTGEAADCDYVEPYRKATAIEFVLDAFNGKVDTVMAKVKHDNYGTLLQQLKDAFRLVNHNGKAFREARIAPRYYDAMLDQLKMAVAVQELKRIDMEEQREIREQMREEEKARREFEKAQRDAEKEEIMLQKAMAEAEKKLASAAAGERAALEEEMAKLRERLAEAEARSQRALSMAQQTKMGYVYVISNIGSFGENIFKIGLTRRLEPFDRIRELGDASVPFPFDVHAMIYSDDAPALEHNLHQVFESAQLNKVNPRKEFFRVPISAIKDKTVELRLETHWTMKAEAMEYRESIQIERRRRQAAGEKVDDELA